QAGTPRVRLATRWTPETGEVEITLTQRTPATPGQADKHALPVPVRLGLLDGEGRTLAFERDGEAVDETLVVLEGEETRVTLTGVTARPVVSALRGFSAPVELSSDARPGDRYVQLAGDSDLFNRWEAGQEVARDLILARAGGAPDEVGEERFAEAMGRALNDQASEPAFKALLLALPTESDLAVASPPADPGAIHAARQALRLRLAVHLEDVLKRLHLGLQDGGEFSPDAASAGRRALRNAALELLSASPRAETRDLAEGHYRAAGNMTDAMGGLNALMTLGGAAFATALSDFHARWKDEPLVIDKWFALQARDPAPEALERVIALTGHPDFDPQTPNRLRALVATFAAANPARFHAEDGSGYRFLADQILSVDRYNPMTAARLVEPLGSWRRYRPDLGAKMKAELERIAAAPGLSRNVLELVGRALEG
ncbi:MAG: DUF3458 domain-containing protein, partial [Phenylobacterium sp.]|uniref:DUF3458 domain-containing protein n=1 Tax=Phenylobacterium sp. TaxID=1871053 RepID=UPI0025F5C748